MGTLSRRIRHGLRSLPVLGPALQASTRRRRIKEWQAEGKPVPPVHEVKQACVIDHRQRFDCRVLIETGTYHGDMVEAVRRHFDRVVSIELGADLHAAAVRRFRRASNVEFLLGDSAEVLPQVLRDLREPAVFWLDGHFSMGETARGLLLTPVARELEVILAHPVKGHVLLIDDAREFVAGSEDYPTLDTIKAWVSDAGPAWTMDVADDIIRITAAGS